MPSCKLTDAQCKAAKPNEKAYKLFDGEGLFLWVSPKGAKTWRMQYRLNGKQQTYGLGAYPHVTLAAARSALSTAKGRLAAGKPVTDSPASVEQRAGMKLRDASAYYWAGRKDVTDGYRRNATRALEMHIFPALGDTDVADITREMLMEQFRKMDAAELYSYERKTRRWFNQVMDWAVEQGKAESNPGLTIRPDKVFGRRQEVQHAHLPLGAVADFLKRLSIEPKIQSVLATRLLMLTWVRTIELRRMKWDQIEGNLWRVPANNMKKGRTHLVPLSRQALAILSELQARSNSHFVFPNDRRLDRPMSENAVLYLLGRIGYGRILTGHGFRTMGSTWANENAGEYGWHGDAVERQLAHAPDDKVRAVYNHAQYLDLRREMLQKWADWLDQQECSPPRVSMLSRPLFAA